MHGKIPDHTLKIVTHIPTPTLVLWVMSLASDTLLEDNDLNRSLSATLFYLSA